MSAPDELTFVHSGAQIFPYLAARVGGRDVGGLNYSLEEDGRARVIYIRVDADWRRRGIALALLDELLRRCSAGLVAAPRSVNSAEGNALIEAFNRRAGWPAIVTRRG